jgi:hypothetical protein
VEAVELAEDVEFVAEAVATAVPAVELAVVE